MVSRALVFDFGTRRIGVASANRQAQTTTALATLQARDGLPDWREIAQLIRDWQPEALVIGLPRNTDGSESDMTARARAFGGWLAEHSGLGVQEIDERFTSTEAEALLRDQRRDGSRSRRVRPGDIDRMAAELIAQTWLRSGPVP
ncbi:MAG: Holliday junction resolvase RuvX [Gammaproteobacteria bacterium]|nr:Holliday junction resolvase RuvX [Gammaproteobacteria bacterium]